MGRHSPSFLLPTCLPPPDGLLLLLVLVLSLVIPDVESRSLRPHRGPIARRGLGRGRNGVRARMANRGRNSRKGRRGGRRGGRNGDIPDADVVTDMADPGTGGGEGGEVCEVLMFDRGDGTYSLKFVQNKC